MTANITIALAATLAIWLFSTLLSGGTEALGKRFHIKPSVRGATLDAVASSFPEFCAVVFAVLAGSFEAGVGTIAGSALFNILIIPAAAALITGELRIRSEVVRRDGSLYLAVVIGLIVAIWLGPRTEVDGTELHALPLWIGLLAIAIYAGYVVLLVLQARHDRVPPPSERTQSFSPLGIAAKVTVGMAGVGVATHFLVHSVLALFRGWGFSEAIAGVTVLAAATSLPDTILSVYAARRGDADGAVSNAFGSNSFDILICLGLPIFVMGGVRVDWANSWPVLAFLLGSTLVSITFLFTELTLTRRESAVMIAIYVVFIALALGGVI